MDNVSNGSTQSSAIEPAHPDLETAQDFAHLMVKLRKWLGGMSQERFGMLLGVAGNTVARQEGRNTMPGRKQRAKLRLIHCFKESGIIRRDLQDLSSDEVDHLIDQVRIHSRQAQLQKAVFFSTTEQSDFTGAPKWLKHLLSLKTGRHDGLLLEAGEFLLSPEWLAFIRTQNNPPTENYHIGYAYLWLGAAALRMGYDLGNPDNPSANTVLNYYDRGIVVLGDERHKQASEVLAKLYENKAGALFGSAGNFDLINECLERALGVNRTSKVALYNRVVLACNAPESQREEAVSAAVADLLRHYPNADTAPPTPEAPQSGSDLARNILVDVDLEWLRSNRHLFCSLFPTLSASQMEEENHEVRNRNE